MTWIKPVPLSEVRDGALYFIGLPPKWKYGTWAFWSEWLNGKRAWSEKPSIALQYEGGDELRQLLTKHADVTAVEVPKDADKRWRKRQRRHGGTKQ